MAPPDLETDVPPPPPSTSSSPSTRPLADPFPGLPPRRASNYQSDIQQLPKEFRNLIAGGLAGMVAKSVVAPADRIKILFQVSSAEFHITRVPKVAWNIIETEGIQALWKGNTATMIRVFPYSGIQFMVFDRCKTYLLQEQLDDYRRKRADDPKTPKPKWGLSPVQSLQAGMIAGATSVLCTYPLDLTRAQLAVLRRHKHAANKGFFGVLKENYMNRGVPGLFRGIGPTMLGILPYSGIAFAFNEQGKRKIQNLTGRDLTTIERMQCGAISGLFAQTITYPLEVTRRRMQTIGIVATSGQDAAVGMLGETKSKAPAAEAAIRSLHPDHPPSMASIMSELYQEQGIRGFFKGVSMNWLKGPVAFAISFTTFDAIKELTETDEERKLRLPRRRTTLVSERR